MFVKVVEFEPARFFERHHITIHCACPKCKSTYSGKAPIEDRPVIPGAQVGPGFLAHIITSRMADHLPYYRQSQIYEREGVFFPDKTLNRYGLAVASLLEPVAKEIKRRLLMVFYLQADETHLDVLDGEVKKDIHVGQVWALGDPLTGVTYYEYHEGRDQEAADALLESYQGALQTDAYVCYNRHPGLRLGCMAHARRYFVKAKKMVPKECKHVISLISSLYEVERELKKTRAELSATEWFEKRREVREEQSKPVLEKLKKYLQKIKDDWLLEEHPMYKAINYMLPRFETFCIYLTDGRFEIDNNQIERAIRPIALGRRNWLFAGSEHGAEMSAVLITVVQSCKSLKINPQKYLADVLPRLADRSTTSIEGLTPLDWKLA